MNKSEIKSGNDRVAQRRVYTPKCDVIERGDSVLLVMDMPGADDKSVELKLEKNTLTVIGRTERSCLDGEKIILQEYREGDYERSFSISDELDRDTIDASIKDGVLQIVIQKSQKLMPRKIVVKSE